MVIGLGFHSALWLSWLSFLRQLRAHAPSLQVTATAIDSVEVEIDTFVSLAGNFNITPSGHMEEMKNSAPVINFGHCNNSIDMFDLEGLDSMNVDNIKPRTRSFRSLQ